MRRRTTAFFLAAGALTAPRTAHAQAQKDSAALLNPVTVVATRSPIGIMRVPLAVTVIGEERLRMTRGYGMEEALSSIPGVIVQSRYGNQDARITIRGFGARGAGDRSNAGTTRGIRVLLDGMPETEPDGRTSLDGVDLASANRIDVVRSNASSLWGNAAGGLVAVSTVPGWEHSGLGFEQSVGSYGLLRSTLRAGTSLGAARPFATFVHSDFDGWRRASRSRRSILNTGVLAQLGDRTNLQVFALGTNNLFYIPGPLTQAQVDSAPQQANATYFSRRERRYNRAGRLGVLMEHRANGQNQFSGMVFINPKFLQRSERGTFRDFTRYHAGANLQYTNTAMLGRRTSVFSVGADEAYQDGAILFYNLTASGERGTTLRDNKREGANNFGVFAQEQLDLSDRIVVTLGARYDQIRYLFRSFITPRLNDQRSFSRVTPKLGLLYRWSDTHMLYANVGGGVEAPAGNETDPASTFGQDTVYGINPLLDPIRSTTWEVGTKHIASGNGLVQTLSVDVAAYHTTVHNEIIPYRGGRFYFTAGEARRRGLEFGATARASHGVTLETSLTVGSNKYQEYLVDSVHYDRTRAGHYADFSGNRVVGVPDVYGSSAISFAPAAARGLGLRLAWLGSGKYFADDANDIKVPGYSVVNATVSFRRALSLTSGVGVRGFLSVNNLANRSYIGSVFLNPDVVNNVPVAFEPGMPRNVVVSFSLERTK